jgi:hypothetical protein
MEGPLQKGYVAENILKPVRKRVALRAISTSCQDNYGKIRPSGLRFDAVNQCCQVVRCKSFLDHNAKSSALAKLLTQPRNVRAYKGWPSRIPQQLRCHLGIAPTRSED